MQISHTLQRRQATVSLRILYTHLVIRVVSARYAAAGSNSRVLRHLRYR